MTRPLFDPKHQPLQLSMNLFYRFLRALTSLPVCLFAIAAADADHAVVWNGRIWTANPEQPWAEAFAVRDGRLVAVGDLEQVIKAAGPDAVRHEVRHGLITPGWIDSHLHLIDAGLHLMSVQLRDASSREEFAERISKFAQGVAPGEWITGGDWDHTVWGGELPDREWIDAVTPHNPVWLQRLDGHMALANSAAMRAAGIDDNAQEVSGGELVREAGGRLTGVFKDNAMGLITRAIPETSLDQRLRAIKAASEHLMANGVTSAHHMGTLDHLDALDRAKRDGVLKTRVYACTPLPEWERLAERIDRRGRGDDHLKIGGLKGFVDGSLGSHTAAMLEPYEDTPASRGLLVNSIEDLERWVTKADLAGLQVAIHAIGDRANRELLDLYERVIEDNGPRDRRLRIEHAQHLAPDDIDRFAKLGVIPSMQPYHTIDDGRWAEELIGNKRSRTTYPFKSLVESGARLAFGSDWFVAPPTPIEGLHAAVTRSTLDGRHRDGWTPEQRLTVEQALRAYTIDAAYASFQEDQIGSLEPGKLADFVVVDRDIFLAPPTSLRAARVVATVVGGEIVYRAEDFNSLIGPNGWEEIDHLIDRGGFAVAEALLDRRIEDPNAPVVSEAARRREMIRRTRADFRLDESQVLEALRGVAPEATLEDVHRWGSAKDLYRREIDGEPRYFRKGVGNLTSFNPEARKLLNSQRKRGKRFSIKDHVELLIALRDKTGQERLMPVRHRGRFSLTAPADSPRFRKGAKVACWLPFPQVYRAQGQVQLLGSGPIEGRVAPEGTPQRSIYFETTIDDPGKPLTFWAEYEFVTHAQAAVLDPERVEPYDTNSEDYRRYTAQREPHFLVTPGVLELSAQIIGDETNPLRQAQLLFAWVSQNIPWRGEREYSTIRNLSAKGIRERCGDCGVQGSVFVALCRAAGIPARWQSGWETKPHNWGMHDWSEFYLEPWGWLPADASYGLIDHADPRVRYFYCGGMDPYRMIVNIDYGRPFDPPKVSYRSEPYDFQRGEIEIDGHNLYFDQWRYDFDLERSPVQDD